jgi:hypothetical protein
MFIVDINQVYIQLYGRRVSILRGKEEEEKRNFFSKVTVAEMLPIVISGLGIINRGGNIAII